jgi:hypothetical protein
MSGKMGADDIVIKIPYSDLVAAMGDDEISQDSQVPIFGIIDSSWHGGYKMFKDITVRVKYESHMDLVYSPVYCSYQRKDVMRFHEIDARQPGLRSKELSVDIDSPYPYEVIDQLNRLDCVTSFSIYPREAAPTHNVEAITLYKGRTNLTWDEKNKKIVRFTPPYSATSVIEEFIAAQVYNKELSIKCTLSESRAIAKELDDILYSMVLYDRGHLSDDAPRLNRWPRLYDLHFSGDYAQMNITVKYKGKIVVGFDGGTKFKVIEGSGVEVRDLKFTCFGSELKARLDAISQLVTIWDYCNTRTQMRHAYGNSNLKLSVWIAYKGCRLETRDVGDKIRFLNSNDYAGGKMQELRFECTRLSLVNKFDQIMRIVSLYDYTVEEIPIHRYNLADRDVFGPSSWAV